MSSLDFSGKTKVFITKSLWQSLNFKLFLLFSRLSTICCDHQPSSCCFLLVLQSSCVDRKKVSLWFESNCIYGLRDSFLWCFHFWISFLNLQLLWRPWTSVLNLIPTWTSLGPRSSLKRKAVKGCSLLVQFSHFKGLLPSSLCTFSYSPGPTDHFLFLIILSRDF